MLQPWVARREGGTELVVLEHLHANLSEHPTARARFGRRAELARHLDHPNLVAVLATGVDDERPWVVTELVPGITLQRLLDVVRAEEEALPLPVFAAVAKGLLSGLDHAHRATDGHLRPLGIVHRSLSPENVQLGFDGRIRLGDFSAARAEIGTFRTAPGVGVGSIPYLSPEQVLSAPIDARSDLYGVSALFFELLQGRRLVAEGVMIDMLRSIAEEPAPGIERPGLPLGLVEVLRRGLEKNPHDRWVSSASYLAALTPRLPDAASPKALAAWLRPRVAEDESRFLRLLDRIRVSKLEQDRAPTEISVPSRSFTPPPDEPELPPEPSVMTMPGRPTVKDPRVLPEVTSVRVSVPERPPSPIPRLRPSPLGPMLAVATVLGAVVAVASTMGRHEPAAARALVPAVSAEASGSGAPRPRAEAFPPTAMVQPAEVRSELSEALKPEKRPAPPPSRRTRARSAPPSALSEPSGPSGDARVEDLRRAVSALATQPGARRFLGVHRRLVAFASELPPARRRRALRLLDAAERAQDPAGLAEVLSLFDSAAPSRATTPR